MAGRRICCRKPRTMTRRRFGALIKASALTGVSAYLARAAEPDYSLVVVPDPQFLAVGCATPLYRGLMNWVLKNQSSAGSLGLNIKAVVGVGDCVNTANSAEAATAQSGWGLLDANG